MKDIHDVIKHAKFGDDCLRGSVVVAGQISAFPIDFAGRPYNTLTLPCERVIYSKACLPCFNTADWKSIQRVKLGGMVNGDLSGVRCKSFAYDPAHASATL